MPRRKSDTDDAVATLPEPRSFQELARDRVREHLREYRDLVARAADEQLGEQELARVLDLLDHLRLPQSAWAADVVAFRDHRTAEEAAAESLAKKPASERRLVELVGRILELEEEVRQLRQERYTLAEVEPATRGQYVRTCNELAARCPHLFFDLDDSVRRLIEAHNRPTATVNSRSVSVGAWE